MHDSTGPSRKGLIYVLLLILCVAAPLAACGDDDAATTTAAPTTAAPTTAAPTTAAPTTAAPTTAAPTTTVPDTVPEGPIVLVSWGGTFHNATREHIADRFTEETGIEVVIIDSTTMVAQIQAMHDAGRMEWDLLDSASAKDCEYLWGQDLIAPLPDDLYAELQPVMSSNDLKPYGFSWATYAFIVACNNETVENCPTSMLEFMDPVNFPGRRMMIGAAHSYSHLMTVLGEVVNNSVENALPVDIDAAEAALREFAPYVSLWWSAGDQQEQAMLTGEVDMGIMYSGRAWNIINQGADLTLAWEGAVFSPGYYVRLADAPHAEAADYFLRWLATNAEAQAAWSSVMTYAPPYPPARDLIPEDIRARIVNTQSPDYTLAYQDVAWYLENQSEIETMLTEVISGG
jgi:putative spermidine/putrescine transport system substrate-binding protein